MLASGGGLAQSERMIEDWTDDTLVHGLAGVAEVYEGVASEARPELGLARFLLLLAVPVAYRGVWDEECRLALSTPGVCGGRKM
jgi:hypothetical protein